MRASVWALLLGVVAQTCLADTTFTGLTSSFFGGTSSGDYAYATAGKQRPCKPPSELDHSFSKHACLASKLVPHLCELA